MPSAPPEPPSPVITVTIGVRSCVMRLIAEAIADPGASREVAEPAREAGERVRALGAALAAVRARADAGAAPGDVLWQAADGTVKRRQANGDNVEMSGSSGLRYANDWQLDQGHASDFQAHLSQPPHTKKCAS